MRESFFAVCAAVAVTCVGCVAGDDSEVVASTEDALTVADLLGWKGGHVTVENAVSSPVAATVMTARFRTSCTKPRRVGLNCTVSAPSTDACPPLAYDAGAITVSGPAASFTLTPDASHAYAPVVDVRPAPLQPFPIGSTVKAIAGGAGIPAFAIEGTVPAAIAASPGVFDAPYVLDTSRDLSIAWDGSAAESSDLVSVQIDASRIVFGPNGMSDGSVQPGTSVECVFPASHGSGIVPAAALAHVPKGVGNGLGPGAPGTSAETRTINFKSERHAIRVVGSGSNRQLFELVTVGSRTQNANLTVQ